MKRAPTDWKARAKAAESRAAKAIAERDGARAKVQVYEAHFEALVLKAAQAIRDRNEAQVKAFRATVKPAAHAGGSCPKAGQHWPGDGPCRYGCTIPVAAA